MIVIAALKLVVLLQDGDSNDLSVKIGTSLFSPLDKDGKAMFGNQGEGAFDHHDLSFTALVFNVGSSGGHIETTASSSSNSQEKVHADISA